MLTGNALGPLSALGSRSRERLLSHAHEHSVRRGQTLFDEGQPASGVYLLVAGRMEMVRACGDGRACTVCVRAPGALFCCLPVLDGGTYPTTSRAAENSVVLSLPMHIFRAYLAAQPDFLFAVHRHVAARLRDHGCDRPMARGDAGSRLAACLVTLAAQFGADLPLCRRVLADLAGTTLETAIRAVKGFERAGWVTLERGRVRVRDVPALRARAAASNGDSGAAPGSDSGRSHDVAARGNDGCECKDVAPASPPQGVAPR